MLARAVTSSIVFAIVLASCTRASAPGGGTATTASPRTCPAAPPGKPSTESGVVSTCASDAECTKGRAGRCKPIYVGHAITSNVCTYDGCEGDRDCATGALCLCGAAYDGRNACLPANCHDDADCSGRKCADRPADATTPYSPSGRFCQTDADECGPSKPCASGACSFAEATGHWRCGPAYYPPPG